ncbi:MAG: FAD-binding oxidoreductase [Chloroflexi bacterium OHK40]
MGLRVVIVGGGVTGLSAAYHLARRGAARVVVVEKEWVGAGSSSRAAGIITGLLWSETGVLARKRSLALFRELSDELEGYRFRDVGCLNLFDAPSWRERQALLPLYERLGAPFEILSAAEIRLRWPALTPPDEQIGLFDPHGGYSEPDEYLPALVRRCRQLGVEIREGTMAEGLLLQGGRACGVRLADDSIEADAVIYAVYAWTLALGSRDGVRPPVKTVVHQRYLTAPLAEPPALPAINANPLGGYIRPASGGRLLAGVEALDREEIKVTDLSFRLEGVDAPTALREGLGSRFGRLVPTLTGAPWQEERVGLISFSMDGEPVVGPVAALPGLYLAVAFHSGGFAYNPVVGELLADMVIDGRPRMNLAAFSPERFDPVAVETYLASTVTQRHLVQRRH